MYHIYQTEGMVIGGINSGDSNRKICLFGREVGLIWANIQNGRSLSSKLRSSVQDFAFGSYSLVRGKNEWKMVGAKTSFNIFESVKNSPEKIRITASIFSLIKKLIEESNYTHELFDTIKEFMFHLPNLKEDVLKSTECLVLLRILNKLGFLRADPDLVICLEETGITPKVIQTISIYRQKTIKLPIAK